MDLRSKFLKAKYEDKYPIEFTEEGHVYRVLGNKVSSVTQIINEYRQVNIHGELIYVPNYSDNPSDWIAQGVMDRASWIGTETHEAVKFTLSPHGLDYDSLPTEVIPLMAQFDDWMVEYKPRILLCEKRLYSPRYNYCGTPDVLCVIRLKGKDVVVLLDLKTGYYETVAEQLSGYKQLIRENYNYKGFIETYVLALDKRGEGYSFEPKPDKRKKHWNAFKADLYKHKYRRAA